MSHLRLRVCLWVFGAYLLLVQVILPLLSPLRALGEIEPGVIRNAFLPPLIFLIILSFGLGRILKARTILHAFLGFAFVQAMIVGMPNILDPDGRRAYFSHLFQVGSAYVLLSAGWIVTNRIKNEYWRVFVILAIISTLIATFFTIVALGSGDIGRLYTPAYGFIFIAAYSSLYSKPMSVLTITGMLVSNKRGPIIAVSMIFFQCLLMNFISANSRSKSTLTKSLLYVFSTIAFAVVVVAASISWASNSENEATAVGRAVNITLDRLIEAAKFGDSDKTLDEISAGRLEEIEVALDSLDGSDFIFGSGAGWSITLGDGKTVQNIHFSPLSVASVFGLPFAVVLYGYFISLVVRSIRRRRTPEELTATERMAPLYLSGALLHSLFAYSLFIDWLVFFFAGVLAKSLRNSAGMVRRPLGTTT